MNIEALIMMSGANLIVAGFTAWFFWKILRKPRGR